ncbi:uncharacterized protein LOC133782539 isoform X1 [Humulus lupulus]|uniref:uncharacterized protein LOC133782539 isoform X1 n=1 Tax=Humulus lupulus TaxID=3486 RepID=UPI002B4094CB|nr:uncharacterized protein LOC133782539 isoform X1 [Humulus lupulus]
MGGGAAMRAASKVAGVGAGVIHHGGLRGATVVPPVEQSVRNPSIPVSAILTSSSQTAKATAADVAGIQRQVWEINDWEFAGGEDDMVMGPGEPLPRVVFDAVPSFQEAKEATVELKDALDKVYLSSPKSSGSEELAARDQMSGLSLFSNPDLETKSCLVVDTVRSPTVPNHAFKAFKLLSTSPEAQNVVASIASDRNVWNAVLQNPVLKDFMDSNQSIAEFQEPVFAESFENSSDWSEAAKGGNWLMGVLKNVKLSVTEMVSNLSGYFQSIFGPSPDTKGDAKATFVDMSLGASFMGLATLAVMVILLRRI